MTRSSNRTFMELKPLRKTAIQYRGIPSSNRTFMELKLAEALQTTDDNLRSNRTFMELKPNNLIESYSVKLF